MNKNNLLDTLAVQTASHNEDNMRRYIIGVASSIAGTKLSYHGGNIYVTKGSAGTFPCVVAHMDTVHDLYDDFKIYEANGNLFAFDAKVMHQVGIGGDDKVGVFIALEMLRLFENIKLVFFTQEEIGCVGSGRAKLSFFGDCAFVLQCDRKGNNNFIRNNGFIELFGQDFENKVAPLLGKYGYSFAEGYITDVVRLKELGLPLAVANIACGYYQPHSDREYVNINDVEQCLNLVYDIIDLLGGEQHYHTIDLNTCIELESWEKTGMIPHETPIGYCTDCNGVVFVDEFNSPYCARCNFYLDESEVIGMEKSSGDYRWVA